MMLGYDGEQKYISNYKISEFNFDIKRWKSLLKHMENELVFINRILLSDSCNTRTTYLNERLKTFQNLIETKTAILKDFNIEVSQYNHKLTTTEHSDSDITDNGWLEQHDYLKHRLEIFHKDFNALKLRILKHTESVL